MIGVNVNNLYSNLLVFRFSNFQLDYPKEIKKIIDFSLHNGDFKELESFNTLGKTKFRQIFVLGLGSTEEFNNNRLIKALGYAINQLKEKITELDILDNFSEDLGFILGQALELSLYKYYGIKQQNIEIKLQKLNLISKNVDSINRGLIVGDCVNFGRQLVNLPSNYVTPKYLAQQAENIAHKENLDIDIMDKYRLEQLGMNGILAVSKGSNRSPRLIALQYFGDDSSKGITAIIGKGVTFDSGGISLKPSKGMESMISDMSGSAVSLAVIKAAAKLKLKKNLIVLIPAVENMPSGSAYKPGDVISTYSGKTVQVISTDAEGRLILCDAISYAKELGASTIIDVATLTGSSANFLGGINMGLSSNSDELSTKLITCGKNVGENIWRFPDNLEYLEELKTDSADLKNTGTKAGAVVAGLFLQSFAEDTAFAHLDIAGCSINNKTSDIYDKGATGTPSRTLIEFLMN